MKTYNATEKDIDTEISRRLNTRMRSTVIPLRLSIEQKERINQIELNAILAHENKYRREGMLMTVGFPIIAGVIALVLLAVNLRDTVS